MAAQPALTWATLQLITIPSVVIEVLQVNQDRDGVPFVDYMLDYMLEN